MGEVSGSTESSEIDEDNVEADSAESDTENQAAEDSDSTENDSDADFEIEAKILGNIDGSNAQADNSGERIDELDKEINDYINDSDYLGVSEGDSTQRRALDYSKATDGDSRQSSRVKRMGKDNSVEGEDSEDTDDTDNSKENDLLWYNYEDHLREHQLKAKKSRRINLSSKDKEQEREGQGNDYNGGQDYSDDEDDRIILELE